MQVKKILEQVGLKENYATVYLANLELGSNSVLKISQKAGLPRSTCESILESLREKGFVTTFKKKNIKHYSPEEPKKLVGIMKERVTSFENALPQFNALFYRGGSLPTSRLYEGTDAISIVFKEILDEASELFAFGSIDDIYNTFGDEFKKFTEKRIKKEIFLKVILKDTALARERQSLAPAQLREVKLVPENAGFAHLTFLWGEKVAMFSLGTRPKVFVIESEELYRVQKAVFDFMWGQLV